MKRKGRKKLGLVIVILALSALIAFSLAYRRPLLLRWHLHRLESADEDTRIAAAGYLAGNGPARIIPLIFRASERLRMPGCVNVQSYVCFDALKGITLRTGDEALPYLCAELKNSDYLTRMEGVMVVRELLEDPLAEPVRQWKDLVAVLAGALSDDIGTGAALQALIRGKDPEASQAARSAFRTTLLHFLRCPSAGLDQKRTATSLLGDLEGGADPEVVQELSRFRDDPDDDLREGALESLQKIATARAGGGDGAPR